ncbi:LlaJI family restriction endonuclease [Yersinia sp. 2542 StPb PI]|uniref:LlaJI family restriction endonuclease n=1 Tax=unclassified Yersinia (in: enterobacteria) TaxID=2653513 RepID=UPI003B281496
MKIEYVPSKYGPTFRYTGNDAVIVINAEGTVIRSPDTTTFAILDAKYYGAENLENLPGWPDLIKQFFYALALQRCRSEIPERQYHAR